MFIEQTDLELKAFKKPRWQKLSVVFKSIILAAVATSTGVLLGKLMTGPHYTLVVAVVSCLAFLLLALATPLYGLVAAIIANPLNYHFAIIDLGWGIPNISLDRLIIAALIGLIFFQAITGQRRLYYTNVYLAAVFFLVAYYLSFYNFSEWTTSSKLQFLLDKWILPVAIFFLVSNLTKNEQNVDVILNLLLILGVYSALYMIYENVTGNILFQYRDSFSKQFYGDTSLRITRGLYGTTTTFGNLYILLLPICLYYFLKVDAPIKKVWYIVVFGLMMIGVFLTYKRSVWIALPLSFLVIQLFYPQFRKFFIVILLVAALGMFVSWDSIMNSEAVTVRITGTDDWQDANGRTERWEAGMGYWERSPIFGSGFRSYTKGPYLQTENLYIHLLASAGLLAFIPFVSMFLIIIANSAAIFRQAAKNKKLFVSRDLIAVFWGGFVAYFFMAYFGSGVEGAPISNFTLFTIMGAIVGSQMPLLLKSQKSPPTMTQLYLHKD